MKGKKENDAAFQLVSNPLLVATTEAGRHKTVKLLEEISLQAILSMLG